MLCEVLEMSQKNLNLILTIAAIFFAVLAIALLIVGIVYDGDSQFTKIMVIIVAVLCFALAGELGYMLFIANNIAPNYFLYDPKTKRNVSVKSLNAQVVNTRMNRYISKYAESEGKLWTQGIRICSLYFLPEFEWFVSTITAGFASPRFA